PVEADRRGLTRVAGVEMRPSVHALIPVHPDRDPVEEADPRHVPTLRAPADGTGYTPQTTRSASAAMDTRFAQRQVPPISRESPADFRAEAPIGGCRRADAGK